MYMGWSFALTSGATVLIHSYPGIAKHRRLDFSTMHSLSRQRILNYRAHNSGLVVETPGLGGGPGQPVLGQRTDPTRKCRWGVLVVLGWLMSGCGSGDMTGKGGVEDTRAGDQVHGVREPGADLGVAWTFEVGGMHCEGCAGGVLSELRRIPGVHWGRVDFVSGQAEVRVDAEQVTMEGLERVVVEAGYTVRWRQP